MINEKEFAGIINSTKRIVLSAIGKNLAERFYHSIDDVVQETYIRAYKSLVKKKFKGESSIGTWLYTIARNESIRINNKLIKEEKKAEKTYDRLKSIEKDEFDADIQNLFDSISKLPDKHRSVMELVSQGLSVKQISERLNIKTGTVKSRASRGRDMLQKILVGGEK